MPKVNLTSTYGYRDPITGERKYYGPGTNIPVPQGLVDTLGLTVLEEDTAEDFATPAPGGQGEAITPPADLLPEDFPGRKWLLQADYTTLSQVKLLSIDDLIGIKGIGTRLAEQILERMKGYDS